MGKSSLINKLLGKNRLIVSDIAGTTRDAVDTKVIWGDMSMSLLTQQDCGGKTRLKKRSRDTVLSVPCLRWSGQMW